MIMGNGVKFKHENFKPKIKVKRNGSLQGTKDLKNGLKFFVFDSEFMNDIN